MCFSLTSMSQGRNVLNSNWGRVVNGSCADQSESWWSSDEAIRIAKNVLLYQRDIGGWPKNVNMQKVLSKDEINQLLSDKSSVEGGYCTIDNNAVALELRYLSKVYNAIDDTEFKATLKEGFQKGIQYLLDAQFDNGGWPQFYPFRSPTSYSNHITYNDNAMVNVMEILRHIYQKDNEYAIDVDESIINQLKDAFDKGVECILNTQYKQNGILTVWCAQHHYETLEPVIARSYELPSLSGGESSGVLRLLMSIKNPSYEVRKSIYSAINWYRKVKIGGQRLERFINSDGKRDRRVVADLTAPYMWGRFYTLDSNTPFFSDRDGVVVFSLAEIGHERRNGYSWYGQYANSALAEYDEWLEKWGNSEEEKEVVESQVFEVSM